MVYSPPYASPSTGAEDIEGQQPPGTSGGASARFDVFAFSVPPPTGDRSSRRDDDAPRDLNSARWATPMSLATPYSEPPITPQDDQALPLPLPVHVRTPWTRYTTDSRTLDPVPQTVSTIPRSADSIPPERVSHNPPEEQRPGNGSAPAPNTASSSDNSDDLPIKEIELQAYDPSDPREFRPSSSLRERPQTDEPGEDDSPYPEVRACVSNTDDLDMPAMTLRMWFIGLTLSVLAACANLFLSLRYPSVYLGPTVIILVAFAVGKLLERITPIRLWIIPSWIPLVGDHSICLNPGPFNIKEHGLISMMANLCANPSYGLTVVLTARNRYNLTLGPGFSFCLYTSILILPFSFGWFTRRLFVYPSSKIWPTNLVLSAMLNTLHAGSVDEDYRLSRLRFFVFVAVSYTCYSFLPDYLFTGLSYFSFICWIRPNNVVVNQLFGAVTGLGMSALTFDWSQIALIGSPLMVPWTVSMQIFAGFVVFYWIVLPILYYTNAWKTGHLPIMGYMAYDRFAQEYDMNRVLNPDKTLNVTAYQEYSPVYIPIGFVVTYLVAFVFTTAVIVATAFDHGREIVRASKSKNIGDDDIHARLMKNYPEVPGLWYVGAVLVSLGLAIATIKIADVDTPVWGLFMAIAVAGAYTIPELYIYSCAGKLGTMNLTVELIGGNIWRGKPLPVMMFKVFTTQWLQSGLTFTENLKLGHYLKIPPRSTFIVQAVGSVVVCAAQVGLQQWIFSTIPDLCEPNQKGSLTCPGMEVFYTASILWGAIGPKLLFRQGFLKSVEMYGLLAGAFLPVVFWAWRKTSWGMRTRPVSILLLVICNDIPPGTGINYSSWFLVSFIFQYLVRTRCFRWWLRYNYVLSVALQSGTAIGAVLVFLLLQLPKSGTMTLNWWGNTVWMKTADGMGVPYLSTDPNSGF